MVDSGAADRFWSDLQHLYQAAGRPTLDRLTSIGLQQLPPIVVSDSTINGWLNRKAIPTGLKNERYLIAMIAVLQAKARGQETYEPLTIDMWTHLLHEAQKERAARKKRGRPRRLSGTSTTDVRLLPLPHDSRVVTAEEFRADIIDLLNKLDHNACQAHLPIYLPLGADVMRMARTVRLLGNVRQAADVPQDGQTSRQDQLSESGEDLGAGYLLPAERADPATQEPQPWTEVSTKHPRLVVLADPGMGKSWLVRAEAHRLAHAALQGLADSAVEGVLIPLPIRADVLASLPGKTLQEALGGYLVDQDLLPPRSRRAVQELIASGNVVLLIDALDEVPREIPALGGQVPRKRLEDLIWDWVDRCTGTARCVLTTRLAGYLGPPVPGAQELELLPFSARDTIAAIQAWDLPKPIAERVRRLLNDPAVAGMARVPLLLALICSLAANLPHQQPLPKTRSALYDAVVWQFLSGAHRSADRGARSSAVDPIERQKLLRVLTQIAITFASTDHGWIDQMSYAELIAAVGGAKNELADLGESTASVLARLVDETGVLVPAGNPAVREQTYVFLHRTIAEYLVARYLRDLPYAQRMRIIKDHQWFDLDWAYVIPLLGGLLATQHPTEARDLVTHFLNTKRDTLYRAFHTALRILGESPDPDNLLTKQQSRALSERALDLLESTPARTGLLRALATAPSWPRSVTDAVLAALPNFSESELGTAIRMLATQEGLEVTEALLDTLKGKRKGMRTAAADALARREALGLVETLLDLFADPDGDVREGAARALGGREDPNLTEALLSRLANPSEDVRKAAVIALTGREDPSLTEALAELLSDKCPSVRYAAVRALRLQDRPRLSERLLVCLKDSHDLVRSEAVKALEWREGTEITQALVGCLSDDDGVVDLYAIKALGWRVGHEVTQCLLDCLVDPNPRVRFTASISLILRNSGLGAAARNLNHPIDTEGRGSQVAHLLAHLNSKEHFVRRAAISALAWHEGTEVTNILLGLLNEQSEFVRWSIVRAVAKRESPEVTIALLDRLGDESSKVRSEAIDTLARREGTEVTKALLRRLHSANPQVRQAAAKALAGHAGLEVTSALLDRLQDKNEDVRQVTVETLAGREGPEVTSALLDRLQDKSQDIQKVTVNALLRREGVEVTLALLSHVNDKDASLQQDIIKSLAARDDPEVLAWACGESLAGAKYRSRFDVSDSLRFELADEIADRVYKLLPDKAVPRVRRGLDELTERVYSTRSL